jgi:lysophospholipase L1-like esterase
MRYWSEKENLPWAYFLNRDGLHLNDYGYKCLGKLVAVSIERAIAAGK